MIGLASCIAAGADLPKKLERALADANARLSAAPTVDIRDAPGFVLPPTRVRVEMGEYPAAEFAGMRSHYVIVGMPQHHERVGMVISPLFNGPKGSMHDKYLFGPTIVFVDGEGKQIGDVVEPPLCHRTGWSAEKTGYFAVITVSPRRYPFAVIYSRRHGRGSQPYRSTVTTAIGTVPFEMTTRVDFPFGPDGALFVSAWNPKLERYLRKHCPESVIDLP